MSASHRHGSSFLVLSLWLVGAGCVSGDVLDEVSAPRSEDPVSGQGQQLPGDQTIRISELQLHGVSDSGLLEIELHLFDTGSNTFLGCSGPLHGLNGVDYSGLRYSLDAHFVPPGSVSGYPVPRGQWLTAEDVADKTLRLVVLEEDAVPCPAPPSADEDDVIAEVASLPGASLAAPRTMQFGDVTHLKIGAVGSELSGFDGERNP